MRIEIDTSKLWMRVASIAFKQAIKVGNKEPDGIPFRRSPEAFCNGYEPRKKKPGDWDDCITDGHYLCVKCCHRIIEEVSNDRKG